MTEPVRKPGYSALRKGRVDLVGARYFLTLTLRRPLPKKSSGLHHKELEPTTISQAQEIREWDLTCIVVMPDHLHLLVTLTEPKLSNAVRILKGKLTPELREHGLKWQSGFYDHRLRPEDQASSVVRYMWLNPYRADLSAEDEPWSGWWCKAEAEGWLKTSNTTSPPPEWWR